MGSKQRQRRDSDARGNTGQDERPWDGSGSESSFRDPLANCYAYLDRSPSPSENHPGPECPVSTQQDATARSRSSFAIVHFFRHRDLLSTPTRTKLVPGNSRNKRRRCPPGPNSTSEAESHGEGVFPRPPPPPQICTGFTRPRQCSCRLSYRTIAIGHMENICMVEKMVHGNSCSKFYPRSASSPSRVHSHARSLLGILGIRQGDGEARVLRVNPQPNDAHGIPRCPGAVLGHELVVGSSCRLTGVFSRS